MNGRTQWGGAAKNWYESELLMSQNDLNLPHGAGALRGITRQLEQTPGPRWREVGSERIGSSRTIRKRRTIYMPIEYGSVWRSAVEAAGGGGGGGGGALGMRFIEVWKADLGMEGWGVSHISRICKSQCHV